MLALVEWFVDALPGPVRRRVPSAYVRLLAQFTQFGVVGLVGFVVDTAVVYAARGWAGLYVGGALAYAVAVTTTSARRTGSGLNSSWRACRDYAST